LGYSTFLNYVTTNDVSKLTPVSAQYSTMCNERGDIIDDLIVSRLGEEKFFMVYNANNRAKNFKWPMEQSKGFHVKVEDVSDKIAMFAVQSLKA
jgi:aminomethyltransferase